MDENALSRRVQNGTIESGGSIHFETEKVGGSLGGFALQNLYADVETSIGFDFGDAVRRRKACRCSVRWRIPLN